MINYERYILENSPERFLNNAMSIISRVKPKNEGAQEQVDIFMDDFESMKSTIDQLWRDKRNELILNAGEEK